MVDVSVDTRLFSTGATRGNDVTKLDYEGFMSPLVLRRFAEYMHEKRLANIPPGQTMRSSDNWQKGVPLTSYMKSMLRHAMDLWEIHRTQPELPLTPERLKFLEDALCAIMFNAMGYLFETMKAQNANNPG